MAESTQEFWDMQAATFDDMPDHGLASSRVREAWRALLMPVLPAPPANVIDLGCGTGSLSLLLAEEGYDVAGMDFAGQMVRQAKAKVTVAGPRVALLQADAEAPPVRIASLDAIVARHVLWALSDVDVVVQRWLKLLRPNGVIVLVEGRWWTGDGLSARELEEVMCRHRDHVELVPLHDPALWGKPINDERYLLVSHS